MDADDPRARHEFVLYAPEPLAVRFDARRFPTRIVAGAPQHLVGTGAAAAVAARDHLDVFFAPAYTAPLRTRIPTVVAIHDVSFAAHPEWFSAREGLRRRWITRQAARRSRAVVTISEFSRREIVERLGVAESRIHVIPPGIEPPGRPRAARIARRPHVLYVGSIFNRRHVPDLIRAFAAVARRTRTRALDIVGDNRTYPPQNPDDAIARSGLNGRASWRKFVSDDELGRLYGSARAFAFLSEYEGLGLTPLEALAAGVPPVLLDTPVARESCGEAALYTARGDVAAVAECARASPVRRQRAQAPARRGAAILAKYDWPRAARGTRWHCSNSPRRTERLDDWVRWCRKADAGVLLPGICRVMCPARAPSTVAPSCQVLAPTSAPVCSDSDTRNSRLKRSVRRTLAVVGSPSDGRACQRRRHRMSAPFGGAEIPTPAVIEACSGDRCRATDRRREAGMARSRRLHAGADTAAGDDGDTRSADTGEGRGTSDPRRTTPTDARPRESPSRPDHALAAPLNAPVDPPGSRTSSRRVMPAIVLVEASGKPRQWILRRARHAADERARRRPQQLRDDPPRVRRSGSSARRGAPRPHVDIAVSEDLPAIDTTQPALTLGATADASASARKSSRSARRSACFQNTLTRGIVSGIRQTPTATLVQTDAAVNPGNSGGPLIERGSASRDRDRSDDQGLNFAVGIDHARAAARRRTGRWRSRSARAGGARNARRVAGDRSDSRAAGAAKALRVDQTIAHSGRRADALEGSWRTIYAQDCYQGTDRAARSIASWFALFDQRL